MKAISAARAQAKVEHCMNCFVLTRHTSLLPPQLRKKTP